MYHRVNLLELAWIIFASITVCTLIFTISLFQNWRIETAGVWSPGTITGITHCHDDRSGARLATVNLSIQFTDIHGTSHLSQTTCEYDRYHERQSIAVRYLPDDPSHILIQADIGSGQGRALLNMVIYEALSMPLLILTTIYAIRRMRHTEAARVGGSRR